MKSAKKDKKRRKLKPSRHRPVTDVKTVHSLKKSQQLISQLHILNKEKTKIQNSISSNKEKTLKLNKIDEEIQKLGGLDIYQRASKSGECRHGNYNTAKWVIQQLKDGQLKPLEGAHLDLLDVGALDLNYAACASWIHCTAVDLNPQKRGILRHDFLNFKEDLHNVYDVVVLSLVVNFVGDVVHRGKMLVRAQQLCKLEGHIFVILPLACLSNSRYMSHQRLEDMMTSLGLDLVTSHNSRKLSFKMFCKKEPKPCSRSFPKQLLRDGAGLNNFSIVIR